MINFVYYLTNLLFIDTPLFYYINHRLSIVFCLYSGNIYLSLRIFLGNSLSCSFLIISELFCYEFLETLLIFLAILLPMKSPIASAAFLIF